MPIISDTNYCIDRNKIEFSLIKKEDYYKKLFNNKTTKIKRFFYPFFRNIPQLRTDNRDFENFENYPKGKRKYIFICTAKCASSSVNGKLNHFIHPEPKFHHMGINELVNFYPDINLNDYFKFTFIRNPWDRFVSLYNDMFLKRKGKNKVMHYSYLEKKNNTIFHQTKNFKEFAAKFEYSNWINEAHFKPQYQYIFINQEISVDYIGRLENLKNDWEIVKSNIGLKDISNLGHEMKSKIKVNNYRKYYDDITKDIVYRMYKKDIDLFNYDF